MIPLPPSGRIAVVAPRNMRFSPANATSIDLHIHETVRWSGYRDRVVVLAQETPDPFTDVCVRFWPKDADKASIVEAVRETDPVLIVVHQHLPTASAIAKACGDIPVALIRHNFQKPPRNAVSKFLKRRTFDRLSAIGFVSECCRDDFRSAWQGVRTPVHVVLNGIDGARWTPAPDKDPLVLFVGRLSPEKGVLEAARAMAGVLADAPSWRGLFVVATAPEHADYARTVRAEIERSGGRIEMIADVPHDTVRDRMARAAILLAPTQTREPFGRVAIEGMASGAVLVASARGGFVEIVGEAGILLDTPDAPSIADALRRLVQDEGERTRLATAGRERVIPRYDLSTTAATFDDLVRSLLPEQKTADRS